MDVNQTDKYIYELHVVYYVSLVVALSIKHQSQIACILFLKLVFCHVYKRNTYSICTKIFYNRKRQPLVENITSVTKETK